MTSSSGRTTLDRDEPTESPQGPDGRDAGTAAGGGWTFRWAIVGVSAMLSVAVVRLGSRALETLRAGLSGPEWVALVLLTALFVYGEGVRALQRRWVPFVAERAREVSRSALGWRVLAPLYAMALVGARARVLVRAWAGVAAIVVAVLLVHAMPEPWRGVVDFAVAAALLWGVFALLGLLLGSSQEGRDPASEGA